MWPILISLGQVKIYSMGVFMFFGLVLGLYYWWKLGRDEHWDEIALFDAFFLSLFTFLFVGRMGYVIQHWIDLGTVYRFLAFLAYPGILYGWGLVGAVIAMVGFTRDKKWDLWKVMDVIVIVLSILILFGSIGAFLNGNNPGKEVGWGVRFPGFEDKYIPVDLWGVIWGLVSFGLVAKVRKNFRFFSWYKGESSMAKDGLATLLFLGMLGLYLFVKVFLEDNVFSVSGVPLMGVMGIVALVTAGILIYKRSGVTIEWNLLESRIRLFFSKRHKRRGGEK